MAGTIQQIAELAGVSRGTVDRALNNRGRVDQQVAERIYQIANDLGYVPKHKKLAASQYISKPKYKIGVITQLCKASFMIQINKGLQDAVQRLYTQGIQVIIKENEAVEEEAQLKAIAELEQEGIHALAIMPVECDGVRIALNRLVEEKQIPVVTFNSDIIGTKRSCFVGLDNWKSGQTAAGLMGMMTRGNGKILVITGYFSNNAGSRRVDGFVEELKKSFPEMVVAGVQCSFDQAEEVEQIIMTAMLSYPGLTGIFVASGGQSGVKSAFEKLNLSQRPYVILYDLIPVNEFALKEDSADFLIDQAGYEQGNKALMILGDILLRGIQPDKEYIYTEINIKTKYNLPEH